MTTNVKTRKFDKLTVAAIIAMVALLVGTMLPCFAFPNTVVYENSLIVSERNNMHFENLLIDVVVIDENGKVKEESARVHLEGEETEYRFTKQDLQEILQTEDEVYIKGITEKALLQITFFTPVVGVCYAVLVFIALISLAFVGIWGAERFLHATQRLFKVIRQNLRRKKTKT